MKSHIFILLFILMANVKGYAQKHISLNGTWEFALAKNEQEAARLADFHSIQPNSDEFQPISVPSNWAVLGFEEPVYRGFKSDKASEGFYIREFSTPKEWTDQRVLLHFGGVWSSAEIWLNGVHLGRHDSGYTSFSFDITGKLNAESPNRLAVRVRQVSREYKFDVFDDWTLGGIYRDVTLEAMPRKRWLDHIVVQTVFDNQFNDADLKISTMVSDKHKNTLPGNYPSPGIPYDLRFTLSAKDGSKIAQRQITIPAHTATDREVSLSLRVESPFHWTAETPYLYDLYVELIEQNEVTHVRTEKVGFRQISTEGGVFRINGQAVKLRGVNRHDEHPDVGRATTREHWLQDIQLMKAANINYIRMAHYTHAKGFIDLCDEFGMYVGNEVSLGGAGHRMSDPSYAGAALLRSYETVVRDINNPSIIYWSIGNEDPLTKLHIASAKLVKSIDPTRPVLIPWRSEKWLPEDIDILSSHYWTPNEYDQLAGQATRPVITTEYTHAYGVDGFGGLEERWKALTKHPSGAGAAIWMWADQGIKTPVQNPKNINVMNPDDEYLLIDGAGWDGIVDSYRNPTRDYLETKAVYAQVYPATNKIEFTPGKNSVSVPIQNEFDFTDLSSIKISWSIWKDEQKLDSGNSSISGLPHTTATFKLPIKKLDKIEKNKTYYAQFIFTHPDGTEINRKSVELEPLTRARQESSPICRLKIIKDKDITVVADKIHYIFNKQTGHLSSATLHGKQLIRDLRPIIWRKLDQSEINIISRQIARETVDLNQYTPSIKTWDIEEKNNKVIIRTTVKYTVDKKNNFIVNYRYSIETDGKLYVHYTIIPQVEVPYLPIVGMSLQSTPGFNNLHWLGLGPYDAYPNKQSAPYLGVWGGSVENKDITGNKSTRWIELSNSSSRIRIFNSGYMECPKANPNYIYILSNVLGRPEKGRKADESISKLRTDTDEPFIGEFCISLSDY